MPSRWPSGCGGSEADWTIKKAGIRWFTNRVHRDETQTVLRAVYNP